MANKIETTVTTIIDGEKYTFKGKLNGNILKCKDGMFLTLQKDDVIKHNEIECVKKNKNKAVMLDLHKWFKMSKQI